ncbi:MAG: chromosome segregation protein SMC [Chloroflexota bacterium]
MDSSFRPVSPLKSLELQGYKTFASRTIFEFGTTITAIVGPNGSGKSNIADAIRWVLGEQSYALLRGKKTEDMIFSGSETRPRASMAMATITFDNGSGWLPIDFAEVSISRRAYRDGTNEYLINGQRVRLREVAELLAQVGLAQRTYTIIGQGLVDAALSLKAEERRRLFEEAAGIGLYRSRREEALRRLEATRHNLERVQDILAELRPRLRSLERQAQRAREYDQVKSDLEAALRTWYGYHWHRMLNLVTQARADAERLVRRRDSLRQGLATAEAQLAATRARIDNQRAELHRLSQQTTTLQAQREQLSTRVAVAHERLRWLIEQARLTQLEMTSLEQSRAALLERLAAARKEVEVRLPALSAAEEEQRHMAAAGEGKEGALSRLRGATRALEELAARQAAWEARRLEASARRAEASTRLVDIQAQLKSAEDAFAQAEARAKRAAEAQRAALARREAAAAEEAEARRRLAQGEADLGRVTSHLADLRARHAALEARLDVLQREAVVGESPLSELLRAAERGELGGVVGRLQEQLTVPAELEAAIHGALGDFADGLAVRTAEDVLAALSRLDGGLVEGRAALLPLAALRLPPESLLPRGAGCLGNAAELVGCPDGLRPVVRLLLGRTLVVRDRDTARLLLSDLPADGRVVTIAGEVFHPAGWVVAGRGRRRGGHGVASQSQVESELARAAEVLMATEREHERLVAAVETVREQVRQAVRAAQAADEAERAVDVERAAAEAARQAAEGQAAVLAARRREVEGEAASPAAEAAQQIDAATAFDAERVRLEAELQAASRAVAAVEEGGAEFHAAQIRARLEAARQALADARAREADLAERLVTIEKDLAGRRARLEAGEAETERLQKEVEESEAALRSLDERLTVMRGQAEPLEAALAESERQRNELEAAWNQARAEVQETERAQAQAQVDLARRQEEMNSLKRRIEDDFGLVAFDFDESVTVQAPLPIEGLVERLVVVETLPLEVETQVERLRAQLRRMGAINPEAQREYVEVKERVEFLTSQVDDLRHAESRLEEVIAELDLLMEREFRKTFDAVAVAFREAFRRLFGGGVARLRMTDPDDLTNTGIDIEARLPGRREQGLAMLSGGERSLTACALVFALLRVSPTPICVLDEVDAMLDEANVARFRDMLRDLSEKTQFIVITHNRETVQAAEVVYGVTMGKDSASRVISLKLDEAEKQMARS